MSVKLPASPSPEGNQAHVISRSSRMLGPIRRWLWYREWRRSASDRQFWRERDPGKNEEGQLPQDESVDLPAIWIAELFTSSTIEGLLEGFQALGWEGSVTESASPSQWMREAREGRLEGWLSLGSVSPLDAPRTFQQRTAPLPAGIESVHPVLLTLTPSITAVVIQFVLKQELAQSLNAPLRAYYQTSATDKPRHRLRDVLRYVLWGRRMSFARSILSPDLARRQAVRTQVAAIEDTCQAWVRSWLPGVFATDLGYLRGPAALLYVTECAEPLTAGARDVKALAGLSIARGYHTWRSTEWPGARLALDFERDEKRPRLVFACRRRDAFPRSPGYSDSDSNRTIASQADDYIQGLLSRWALTCLLNGYHYRLSLLRDDLATRRDYSAVRDLERLRALASGLLYDITIATGEVLDFIAAERTYRHNVLSMQSADAEEGDQADLLNALMQSQSRRATQLQLELGSVRSALDVMSSTTVAISNMRIQWGLVLITVISLMIAMAALVLQAGRGAE